MKVYLLYIVLPTLLVQALCTAEYREHKFGSWTIHVEVIAESGKKEWLQKAHKKLERDLLHIEEIIPEKHLVELKKVPFWISYHSQRGAAYHPSREWLIRNDRHPGMARSIEIQNAKDFINWASIQPMMTLHELSHGYHHQVLDYNHEGIKAAYAKAKEEGLYDKVPHLDGRPRKAYAMTNDKEYFAELTEAYFGKNDFYPFIRSELKEHDPLGYALVAEIWK